MNGSPSTPQGALLRTLLVVVAVVAALTLAVYAVQAVFLLLTGILFGVLLDGLTGGLSRWSRIPHWLALTLVVLAILGTIAALALLVVPTVAEQVTELVERVPGFVRQLSHETSDLQESLPSLEKLAQPAWKVGSGALEAVGAVVVIAFLGLYLAVRPEEYVSGFVRLFPPPRRERAREIMAHCARQLRRWMLATGVAMLSAGLLTGVSLWLLGARFALAIGLVAGLLEFVPNFGPLAAAALAVLLSVAGGEGPVWWQVLLVFAGIQTFQSYVIQPLTQRGLVDVPPALGIGMIVFLGWVSGALGVLVGIPLLVIARVLIKVLWWRDHLGEPIQLAAE